MLECTAHARQRSRRAMTVVGFQQRDGRRSRSCARSHNLKGGYPAPMKLASEHVSDSRVDLALD